MQRQNACFCATYNSLSSMTGLACAVLHVLSETYEMLHLAMHFIPLIPQEEERGKFEKLQTFLRHLENYVEGLLRTYGQQQQTDGKRLRVGENMTASTNTAAATPGRSSCCRRHKGTGQQHTALGQASSAAAFSRGCYCSNVLTEAEASFLSENAFPGAVMLNSGCPSCTTLHFRRRYSFREKEQHLALLYGKYISQFRAGGFVEHQQRWR